MNRRKRSKVNGDKRNSFKIISLLVALLGLCIHIVPNGLSVMETVENRIYDRYYQKTITICPKSYIYENYISGILDDDYYIDSLYEVATYSLDKYIENGDIYEEDHHLLQSIIITTFSEIKDNRIIGYNLEEKPCLVIFLHLIPKWRFQSI